MNSSSRIRWVENLTRFGVEENEYRILVGEPEGKKPLARPKGKCNLNKLVWGNVNLSNLAQDTNEWRALLGDSNVTSCFIKCGKFLDKQKNY
jgi:hypothetical protein